MATSDRPLNYGDFGDSNGDLVLTCGFKLFINGVDVSDHVIDSISWSYGERGSDNSCSFTLDNNNSKFELRPTNLGLSVQTSSDNRSFADSESYATTEPWKIEKMVPNNKPTYIVSAEAESRGLSTYSETAKRKLYLDKLKHRVKIKTQDAKQDYTMKSYTDLNTGALKANEQTTGQAGTISLYEGLMHTKSCVINIMDHVRLYIPAPNEDPVDEADSYWINVYTGFVQSAMPEHDFSTGRSTVSVTCTDIRTLLKRKRVLVNPLTADQITPTIGLNSGLFADVAVANNNTTNAFADQSLNFEKLIALALTGVDLQDATTFNPDAKLSNLCLKYGERDMTSRWIEARNYSQIYSAETGGYTNKPSGGFAGLWFGYYFEYDASFADKSDSAKKARSEFMNEWNRLCSFGMRYDYLSWNAMMIEGMGTKPGGTHSALNALIHILVPTSGAQITNLLDRTLIDQMGVQREYMSIGDIIEQVCERLDYQYTVSGTGDIVFEFPFYDFTAEDMGKDYRGVYAVSDSVKNHSMNDEANSNPVTALRVTGGYSDAANSPGAAPDIVQAIQYTVYITHDLIAARYGFTPEDYPIPFLTNGPDSTMTLEKYKRQLILFGLLEFFKRMSEMSSLSISSCYNPYARPNRPYYYNYGRRLGVTASINNTLSLFNNADTSVDSKYIRRVHDITGELVSFGGTIGLPLKYSDKRTLDSFYSDLEFTNMLEKLGLAGINILIPNMNLPDNPTNAAKASGTSFSSLNKRKTVNQHLACWTQADVDALKALCDNQGANMKDVMMVIANESGFATHALNTASKNKKGETFTPTYAVGYNQLLPANIINIIETSPDIRAKYPQSTDLLDGKYKKSFKSKPGYYVPVEYRQEFVNRYYDIFNTPKAQLEMFDAFLTMCKNISKVDPNYKFDTLEKLSVAQIASGSLKTYDKTGNIRLTKEGSKANEGLDSTNTYAAILRRNHQKYVDGWIESIGKQENCTPGSSTYATGNAPVPTYEPNKESIMFKNPTTFGGVSTSETVLKQTGALGNVVRIPSALGSIPGLPQ